MPYIALQLVGIQVVLGALGVDGDWPLIIAFVDPRRLHLPVGPARARADRRRQGRADLHHDPRGDHLHPGQARRLRGDLRRGREGAARRAPEPGALIPRGADAQIAYATLALGSALALFLYPHAITAVLSAKSAQTIRRNAALLPAYTFLLGLIALLGYMAIARGIETSDPNFAVPDLFLDVFPSWFVGFAFAAIAIGALVPAAVMSIAAANLFTRNDLQGVPAPEAPATPTRRAWRRSRRWS